MLRCQHGKVGIHPRIQPGPNHLLQRDGAFARELDNTELLPSPERILLITPESGKSAELVEAREQRTSAEHRRAKKLPPVLPRLQPSNHICTTMKRQPFRSHDNATSTRKTRNEVQGRHSRSFASG